MTNWLNAAWLLVALGFVVDVHHLIDRQYPVTAMAAAMAVFPASSAAVVTLPNRSENYYPGAASITLESRPIPGFTTGTKKVKKRRNNGALWCDNVGCYWPSPSADQD
jgi:hypothetical protein